MKKRLALLLAFILIFNTLPTASLAEGLGGFKLMESGNEILRSVKALTAECIEQGKDPEELTEDDISRFLYSGSEHFNVPDPDLIIRTSGEERMSNFLTWQGAYSELMFTDTLWPDFTPDEYAEMIEAYANRDRRFGGRK